MTDLATNLRCQRRLVELDPPCNSNRSDALLLAFAGNLMAAERSRYRPDDSG